MTRTWRDVGDDGDGLLFSAAWGWSGASGHGGKSTATRKPWRVSNPRSWAAAMRSPAATWRTCCPGIRISNGGITYLLGSCELARGRNQAADAAWARVLPGSAFSERAIRGRLRLLQESGQFAAAEQLINEAARDRRNDATALRVLLVPMFSDQGRIVEADRLIADRWEYLNSRGEAALEPAIKLLREHIELTWKPTPVEKLHAALRLAVPAGPR